MVYSQLQTGLQLVRGPTVVRVQGPPLQLHCMPNSKQRKEVSGPRVVVRLCWLGSKSWGFCAEQSSSSETKITTSMASLRMKPGLTLSLGSRARRADSMVCSKPQPPVPISAMQEKADLTFWIAGPRRRGRWSPRRRS